MWKAKDFPMVVAHVVCVIYAKLLTLFEIFYVPINRLPLLAWLCPVTQRTSSFIYACSMTSRAAKTLTQLRPPTNGQTSDISRRGRFTMTITFHAATLPSSLMAKARRRSLRRFVCTAFVARPKIRWVERGLGVYRPPFAVLKVSWSI